jgi:hypothetical protein
MGRLLNLALIEHWDFWRRACTRQNFQWMQQQLHRKIDGNFRRSRRSRSTTQSTRTSTRREIVGIAKMSELRDWPPYWQLVRDDDEMIRM